MTYSYEPEAVCPREINFKLDGNKVRNLSFIGGCNGNLKALSLLIEGKTIEDIKSLFKGQTCGKKESSCMDQLVVALEKVEEEIQ